MSAAPSTSLALSSLGERKALMPLLGEDRVAVRLDADGFLRRVQRKVRLQYGTDLYSARPSPQAKDKVQPFQPGYMKLAAAMGGQLLVPPTFNDPVTGERRANPIVELYPGTGIIRRVTAMGLCAARNPVTGEWHVSTATIIVDGEHILRQALLKMDQRDDAVQYVTEDEYIAGKATTFKGWAFLSAGPIGIAYNMKNPTVKGAYQTFTEQSATMRQRACSKAERLAADHNPVMRMTWDYGMLTFPDAGPAYIDIPVVSWVEHRERNAMDAFIESMALNHEGAIAGVAEIVRTVENGGLEEVDEEEPDLTRSLPDYGAPADPLAGVRSVEREVVVVEVAPVAAPTPTAPSPTLVPAEPASRVAGDLSPTLNEIIALEARIDNGETIGLNRDENDITEPLSGNSAKNLRAYLSALKAEVGA
jgi:hypothetical protein